MPRRILFSTALVLVALLGPHPPLAVLFLVGVDLLARPHRTLNTAIAKPHNGVSVRDWLFMPVRIAVIRFVGDVRGIANRIIKRIALVDDFQADRADLSAASAKINQ